MIERVEGRYEVQDVEVGRVYKWRPEQVTVECDCGERAALTASESVCRCGVDHTAAIREETVVCSEDEILHPWRYAGDRADAGIPY